MHHYEGVGLIIFKRRIGWLSKEFLLKIKEFSVVDGGGPVPSALGRTAPSGSQSRRKEGRHPTCDEFHLPPPGQVAEEHSCATAYKFTSFHRSRINELLPSKPNHCQHFRLHYLNQVVVETYELRKHVHNFKQTLPLNENSHCWLPKGFGNSSTLLWE